MENIDNAVETVDAAAIANVDLDKFEQRIAANEGIQQDETDIGGEGLVEEPTVH